MSATHISREQLKRYRDRALMPQELVAVDAHLGQCLECRDELTAMAVITDSTVSAVREALFEHITYEQMDAWVDNQLDQSERELVMAHIGLCAPCARQLRSYESYAPVMSAAVIAPAQPVVSIGEKLRAWFRMPQVAMITAALAIAAIVTPLAMRDSSKPLTMAQLEALPDSVRGSAKAVINANSAERPEALAGLPANHDTSLAYPVSEVIEERQPILRWESFGSSYSVEVVDSHGQIIAQSPVLNQTHWLVPMQLVRGEQYTWRISSNGQARTASFRVLSASDEQKLSETRASGAGPLALGAVAENMGLLSVAQQEFSTAGTKDAAKLLDHVMALRGR